MSEIVSLGKVFNNRLFNVPDYQRGYAWDRQQRSDLLEDLEDMPEGKEHYTGTLVLHPSDGSVEDAEGNSYQRVDVVDGQQRLTTLVILLSVIARALKDAGRQTLGEGIKKRFVATTDMGDQALYKLHLAGDLHHFLAAAVLPDSPTHAAPAKTAAEKRLLSARDEFTNYVNERKTNHDFEPWLQGLHTKITNGLRLSVYSVGDNAEVGVIFEVMNNRGRPLTELEKVKNHLLYLATRLSLPTDGFRDLVNESWADVYERLMGAELSDSKDEDQLLRAHWLATVNHDVRSWSGSRSVKERFHLKKFRGRERELLTDLHGYVKTLRDAAVPFVDALAPWHGSAFGAFRDPALARQARRWGEKISRMWVIAPFVPLLIATRLRAPIDGQMTVDLLELCERYAFRVYRWGERRSNTGQSTLYQMARERYDEKLSVTDLLARLRGLLHWYHGEHHFAAELQEQPRDEDNDWYHWSGIRYFLYEWEEQCAGGAAVRLSWDQVSKEELAKTVEHILPQSPTDPYWQSHFTDDERKRYTHDIGNVVLTQYNPSLSNKGFDDKKGAPGPAQRCYANSSITSERELASLAQWDVAALKARRQRIIDWARVRWGVSGPAVAAAAPLADDDETAP